MIRKAIKYFGIDTKAEGALDALARNPLPIAVAAVAALAPPLYNYGVELFNSSPQAAVAITAVGALAGTFIANATYSVRKVLAEFLDADKVLEEAYAAGDDLGEPQFEEE